MGELDETEFGSEYRLHVRGSVVWLIIGHLGCTLDWSRRQFDSDNFSSRLI